MSSATTKAVFLSCASQDADATRRSRLRQAVWGVEFGVRGFRNPQSDAKRSDTLLEWGAEARFPAWNIRDPQ